MWRGLLSLMMTVSLQRGCDVVVQEVIVEIIMNHRALPDGTYIMYFKDFNSAAVPEWSNSHICFRILANFDVLVL